MVMSTDCVLIDVHGTESTPTRRVLFFKLNGLMISEYLGLMQNFSDCGDRGDLKQVPSEG
jgi:hypothetical protein